MELTPRRILVHAGLFALTFITTTLAGAEWVYGKSILAPGYTWGDFQSGMAYSVPFLLVLSIHEFGHYFTAIHYRVRTTLPFYIPLPPLPFLFGTLGAVIRLKSRIASSKVNFDVGIAGPLAGFIAAIGVLWYGFSTLPAPEYIFEFHPQYEQFGLTYADHVYRKEFLSNGTVDVIIGKNLLYVFLEKWFGDPQRVPNVHEIMHYPWLFAGYLSLVFTSLNLLPVGQLDGGHVLYGLVGARRHKVIASFVFVAFLFYAGLGYLQFFGPERSPLWHIPLYIAFLYFCLTALKRPWLDTLMFAMVIFTVQFVAAWLAPAARGYPGWMLFALIIARFVGVEHPPCEIEEPLDPARQWMGWAALLVFILTFAPAPLELILTPPSPEAVP